MTLTRRKITVAVQMSDGVVLEGFVVIERTARLSDVLNNMNKDFLVLSDDDNQAHILNKQHIVKVLELNDEAN